jgi:hypothetical protein
MLLFAVFSLLLLFVLLFAILLFIFVVVGCQCAVSLSITESWGYVPDFEGMVFGTLSHITVCPPAAAARRARGLHSSARPCRILVMPRLHPPLSVTLER